MDKVLTHLANLILIRNVIEVEIISPIFRWLKMIYLAKKSAVVL